MTLQKECWHHVVCEALTGLWLLAGYIGEFEYVDDHRGGKIVVELNGRCLSRDLSLPSLFMLSCYPLSLRSLHHEVSTCNTSQSLISGDVGLTTALLQIKQVRRHLPTVRCEAWRN